MSTSAYQLSFVFGDEEAVMSQLTKVGLTDAMC